MAARFLYCGSVLLLTVSPCFAIPIGTGIDFIGTTFGAELCYNDLDCPAAQSPSSESLDFPNDSTKANTISQDGLGLVQQWAVLATQELDLIDDTKATVTFEFRNLTAQNIQGDQRFVIRILDLNSQPTPPANLLPELALTGPITGEFVIDGNLETWEYNTTDFPNSASVQFLEGPTGQYDLELDFGFEVGPGLPGGVDIIQNVKITLPLMMTVRTPEPTTILLLAGFGLCVGRRRGLGR